MEGQCGVLGWDTAHPVEMDVCRVRRGVLWDFCAVRGVSRSAGGTEVGQKDEKLTSVVRFFKTIAGFAYNIPVIGPYLARGLQVAGDKAGANERAHKDLPV